MGNVEEQMKEKRYIFLDADGVLNHQSDWSRLYVLNPENLSAFGAFVDHLREKYEVQVILSTNWRIGFSKSYAACSAPIQEILRFLRKHGITSVDATEMRDDADRGAEVGAYIRDHDLAPKDCIVIDDDIELFRTPLPRGVRMIHTDPRYGFRNEEEKSGLAKLIERIRSMLRG